MYFEARMGSVSFKDGGEGEGVAVKIGDNGFVGSEERVEFGLCEFMVTRTDGTVGKSV